MESGEWTEMQENGIRNSKFENWQERRKRCILVNAAPSGFVHFVCSEAATVPRILVNKPGRTNPDASARADGIVSSFQGM